MSEKDGITCEDGYTLVYAFKGSDGLEHLKDRIIRSMKGHYNTDERNDIIRNGVIIVKAPDWDGSHFDIRTPVEYAFDLENKKNVSFVEYLTPTKCRKLAGIPANQF